MSTSAHRAEIERLRVPHVFGELLRLPDGMTADEMQSALVNCMRMTAAAKEDAAHGMVQYFRIDGSGGTNAPPPPP